jgi:hypothetical protein
LIGNRAQTDNSENITFGGYSGTRMTRITMNYFNLYGFTVLYHKWMRDKNDDEDNVTSIFKNTKTLFGMFYPRSSEPQCLLLLPEHHLLFIQNFKMFWMG